MTDPRPVCGPTLEQHHRAIDAHLAAFAESISGGSVNTEALATGSHALRHHIYVEEELHFPPLREAGLAGPLMVMMREHGQIWGLLDQLEELAANAEPSQLMGVWQELERVLTAHNLKEEQIVYPTGDKALAPEVADRVVTALETGDMPSGWVCQMG